MTTALMTEKGLEVLKCNKRNKMYRVKNISGKGTSYTLYMYTVQWNTEEDKDRLRIFIL